MKNGITNKNKLNHSKRTKNNTSKNNKVLEGSTFFFLFLVCTIQLHKMIDKIKIIFFSFRITTYYINLLLCLMIKRSYTVNQRSCYDL